MKERLAKSVFWMVWSRAIVQAFSFLSTLVVARLLSPADYGLMALASIWTNVIASLTELGLGAAIIQFQDLEECELNTCFWLTMSMAGLGYLALYISAGAIASWFANSQLSDVLRMVGLTLPIVAMRVVPDSLLRKRLMLDKVSQAEIASVLLTIPLVLGMAWAGTGVWALVIGALVMPLVQTIVSFWFVRWWPGFRVGGKQLRDVILYSLATLGARICWGIYEQADTFVLGKVSGDVVLGFYSMAKQLAILPVTKVAVAVNQLASPMMARLQVDRNAMRLSFLRGLRLVACLTIPLCIGMALVAKDLVWVVLGDKWLQVAPLLPLLCLSALIHSLGVLMPPVLFARYRAAFLLWWTVGLVLVMPFAFWAGAAGMGARGVALATVVVYPLLMAWMAREALEELEIGWRTIWNQLRPMVRAALMMVGFVLVVHWTIPGLGFMDRFVRLALSFSLGALVYGLGVFCQGGLLVTEIAEVAGWLLRRSHPLRAAQ